MTNQKQCEAFWQARKSIILSTVNVEGGVETSVAPFISDDTGNLYIFISELSKHTQNVLSLLQSRSTDVFSASNLKETTLISALLVADESETEQLFARERLTLQLFPSEIARNTPLFSTVLTQFETSFGEVVSVLASLPDFHLIQLKVVGGGYVKGFGQAFTFEGCPCQALEPVRKK